MGLKERFRTTSTETPDGATTTGALPNAQDTEGELRRFRRQHKWDPFLDIDKLDNIDAAVASGDAEKRAAVDASLIQEDSPYPEVRQSVRIYPEIHLPVLGARPRSTWLTNIGNRSLPPILMYLAIPFELGL
jgi:hypothetical protein